MEEFDCDVWLLTEVPLTVDVPGCQLHLGGELMGASKHWAGILACGDLELLPDPHPASAACVVDGVRVCSSVLPWLRADGDWPWGSPEHTARMSETLEVLAPFVGGAHTIWGGDWNSPLVGNLQGFSSAAQGALLRAVELLGLQVATKELPHRNDVQKSIDHIGVPSDWTIRGAGARRVGRTLSDHDPYWVEVDPGLA